MQVPLPPTLLPLQAMPLLLPAMRLAKLRPTPLLLPVTLLPQRVKPLPLPVKLRRKQ